MRGKEHRRSSASNNWISFHNQGVVTSPAHVVTGFDIRKFWKFRPKFLVEWNARTGSRPFPLPIIPRAPSETQYYSKLSHREPLRSRGAGVTYLRYTVLTSPNKDETAVHCCDPALSVLVMSDSQTIFHVVSASQFIISLSWPDLFGKCRKYRCILLGYSQWSPIPRSPCGIKPWLRRNRMKSGSCGAQSVCYSISFWKEMLLWPANALRRTSVWRSSLQDSYVSRIN